MRKSIYPLWLTLSEIKIRLRLSLDQKDGGFPNEEIEIANREDTVGYEITGIGELNRIIELTINSDDDEPKSAKKRFHKLKVYLGAGQFPEKKHAGKFYYAVTDDRKILDSTLSIFFNVPELPFNRFCNEIASKRIENLQIAIELEGSQEDDVGAFGPPDID